MSPKPFGRAIVDYPAEIANACDFKDNDTVIVVKDAETDEYVDYLAGLERCLNDPHRLKGPAIIYRAPKCVV